MSTFVEKRLSPLEKVDILLRDVKFFSKFDTFSDGSLKHKFWESCKTYLRCETSPYSKLLENEFFKNDYERYKSKKEKKKDIVKVSVEEKIEILLQDKTFFKQRDKIALFPDKTPKGKFWDLIKQYSKCNKMPYAKLLQNEIYRRDYEQFQSKKEQKKYIVKVSIEEKIDILLRENKIYSQSDKCAVFSDGSSKSFFWQACKGDLKCEKGCYVKLLENPLYRQDYERYKKKKL